MLISKSCKLIKFNEIKIVTQGSGRRGEDGYVLGAQVLRRVGKWTSTVQGGWGD